MSVYTKCAVLGLAAAVAGCASSPTEMKVGSAAAKTTATGSAGGATATNESSQFEKCDRSFGTVAIVED